MRNVLVVISGPSGVGKGTLAKMLQSDGMDISISCTTRSPRAMETNGKDYFFIDKETFQDKIKNNEFLEYSEHFENFYGTPKDYVLEKLKSNDVLLEIDVNGGLNVKKAFEKAVLIFVTPPSLKILRERLIKRNTESLEKIELRLKRVEFELQKQTEYDYVVVNDNLNVAYEEIKEIIKKEKLK